MQTKLQRKGEAREFSQRTARLPLLPGERGKKKGRPAVDAGKKGKTVPVRGDRRPRAVREKRKKKSLGVFWLARRVTGFEEKGGGKPKKAGRALPRAAGLSGGREGKKKKKKRRFNLSGWGSWVHSFIGLLSRKKKKKKDRRFSPRSAEGGG